MMLFLKRVTFNLGGHGDIDFNIQTGKRWRKRMNFYKEASDDEETETKGRRAEEHFQLRIPPYFKTPRGN